MEKKKHPLYIGVFAVDDKESKKKAREYALNCLKEIQAKFPTPEIQADIDNFETTFSFPKDVLHITSLFIGNKPVEKLAEKERSLYKEFQFGEKQPIICDGLLYAPGHIITALCRCQVCCNNKHMHMTLFVGKNAKPVESNDICQEFFHERDALAKSREFQVQHHHNDKAFKNYQHLYLCGSKLELEGVCRGP